jgi:hypothetical protein
MNIKDEKEYKCDDDQISQEKIAINSDLGSICSFPTTAIGPTPEWNFIQIAID